MKTHDSLLNKPTKLTNYIFCQSCQWSIICFRKKTYEIYDSYLLTTLTKEMVETFGSPFVSVVSFMFYIFAKFLKQFLFEWRLGF